MQRGHGGRQKWLQKSGRYQVMQRASVPLLCIKATFPFLSLCGYEATVIILLVTNYVSPGVLKSGLFYKPNIASYRGYGDFF